MAACYPAVRTVTVEQAVREPRDEPGGPVGSAARWYDTISVAGEPGELG